MWIRVLFATGAVSTLIACSVEGSGGEQRQRIEVDEHNEMGITAIETIASSEGALDIFELRALRSNDEVAASITWERGVLTRLTDKLPGEGNTGSIITTTGTNGTVTSISREIENVYLLTNEPALALPAVQRVLASAGLRAPHTSTSEQRTVESAYATQTCPASYLLTTPQATHCCFGNFDEQTYGTFFVRQADQWMVSRHLSSSGVGCRAANGVSTCAGNSCTYGPNGFGRAWFSYYSDAETGAIWYSYIQPKPVDNYPFYGTEICMGGGSPTPVTFRYYGDVTGNFAPGRGCCVNGAGPCGPGLQACSSCGGGGSAAAGIGQWDY